MERNELIELVKRIISVVDTEEKIHELIDILEDNVLDPKVIDYIYGKEYQDLTPEQIVDKALSYKSFLL